MVSWFVMPSTYSPLYQSPDDQSFLALARGGIRQVVNAYEAYGLHLPPLAKDLVCRMLHHNPTHRPTLEEVLLHPFVAQAPHDCHNPSIVRWRPSTHQSLLVQ